MKWIHANCDQCGEPVVRNAATCKHANVKRHFCGAACKAAFQRLAKPVTKEWLYEQYVTLGKDCPTIAREVKRDPKSVWNWLKDFGIPTRPRGGTTLPHSFKKGENGGSKNPFFGKRHSAEFRKAVSEHAKATGRMPFKAENGPPWKGKGGPGHPSWKGGITPERQAFYQSDEWKRVERAVKKRDKHTCQRCGKVKKRGEPFDIHHIVSFVCVELRAVESNLVYLCEPCHYWVHGKENTEGSFLLPCP